MSTQLNFNRCYESSSSTNEYSRSKKNSYSSSITSIDSSGKNSFTEVVNGRKRMVENLMSKYRIGEPFITLSHEFYMEELAFKDVKCLDDLINEFFEKSMHSGISMDKNVFRQLQMDFEQVLHQQYSKSETTDEFSLCEITDENDLSNNVFSNNVFSKNVEVPVNLISNNFINNSVWIPKGTKNCSTKIPYEYENYLNGFPFLVRYEVVRLFKPFGPINYSINILNKLNNCKTAFDFYEAFESICKEHLMDPCKNFNGQELSKLIPYNRLLWEVQETNKSIGKRKHIYYSADITMRNGKLELNLNPPRTCQSKLYYRMFYSERFLHIKINKEIDIEKLDEKKFSLLKNLLLNPIELVGRTYELLYAREGTLYYFATNGSCLEPIKIWDAINWDVPIDNNLKMTTAKFYSRISLGFSDSTPAIVFSHDQIRYNEPDIENVLGQVLTDGCAPISLAVMRQISKVMDCKETPQFIQARIGGAKGIWFLDPQVRDPYELRIDLRQSQTKYKLDFTINNYHLRTLDLVRIIKVPDRPATLNAQLIRILENGGVPAQVFIDMMKENIQKIKEMVVGQDDPTVLRAWIVKSGNIMRRRIEERIINKDSDVNDYGSNCSEVSTNSGSGGVSLSGFPDNISEVCIEMLDAGFTPSTCPFLAKKLKQLLKGQLTNIASKYHIETPLSRSLVCVADPTNTLEEGEIFIQLDGEAGYDERGMRIGIIEGDVLLCRNPCALPSDVQKARAVNNPYLCKYYNVVIFPVKAQSREGPLAAKLSGGDYDGDKVFCCWDPRLTESFQNSPVSETLPEVKNAFTKCIETIGDYLAPVRDDMNQCTKKVQRLILDEYFKDMLTPIGMYDYYHRIYSSHFGLSDPKSIYLAQVNARLLDATKQGETLKPSVFSSDRKYTNFPIPYWMDKDKSNSNTRSVCFMDDLKKVAQEETAFVNSPEFSVVLNARHGLDPHIHQFWLREFDRASNLDDGGRYKKDLELIINVTSSILRKYNNEIKRLLNEDEEKDFMLKHVDRSELNHDISLFELRLKAAALYIQSFSKNVENEGCWKLAFRVLCGLKARMLESENSDIVGGPRTVIYEVWQSLNVDRRWRNA
ncbi:13895_t:CDS:2 [Dentiscutata heterogama]|uniref:13895_t:CDS:1 n=1 Tax=Dentiscutata heterogama TaxID=1316150 RepID=A0ACA9KPT1_9GLOM|nr:13895_t:CDS:2 [Dentiscutata heterogama]